MSLPAVLTRRQPVVPPEDDVIAMPPPDGGHCRITKQPVISAPQLAHQVVPVPTNITTSIPSLVYSRFSPAIFHVFMEPHICKHALSTGTSRLQFPN